jgi:hypothetical protein
VTTPYGTGGNAGVGYPAHQVVDGNLDVVDVYGTGQYGIITARQAVIGGQVLGIVPPSGDTSGATDYASIQASLSNYQVTLLSGTYYTYAPLTLASDAVLAGVLGARGATAPTAVYAAAGFSGAQMIGFASGSSEQEIRDLSLDGSLMPAGTCYGVNGLNAVSQVKLTRMLISGQGFSSGIRLNGSGGNPVGWSVERVSVRGTNGTCILLASATDGNWRQVQAASSVTGDAWSINGCQNSRFVACQGDRSVRGFNINGTGWGTGAGSGGAVFTGCTSDQNSSDGCQITSTGTGPIVLDGCSFRRDGNDGTSTRAGVHVNGATTPVVISGLGVFPGTQDNGSGNDGPAVGLSVANATSVTVDNAYIQGVTSSVVNGGGNTRFSTGKSVVQATGPTTAPVIAAAAGPAAPFASHPSAPTGTVSTTAVMMGLGSTWTFTPASSGVVLISVSGAGSTTTAVANFGVGCRYGTGTAPANGAAASGTRFGSGGDFTLRAVAVGPYATFTFPDVLSLTAGTAYWFDLTLLTGNASDQAIMQDVSVIIVETS